MFAQQKVILPNNIHKIIILDEADSMTSAAMQAMRRTMELYSSTTRFVLICNNSSKIIEPIQSRCSMIRYIKLDKKNIIKQIKFIAENENINITDDGLNAIIFTSNGDMRQAINILQTCSAGFKIVNEENIFYIADIPHPQIIKDLILKCIDKNVNEACKEITNIYQMGYSATDIIGTIYNVSKSLEIPDNIKLYILKEIGFIQLRISEGLNTLCQLVSLIGYLSKVSEI
jgi:replication factor C subunit 2/4